MPAHSLREMASPKQTRAMSEVATISKLFNSEALAAVVRERPTISAMGAAMSSATIPTVKGSSLRVSRCSHPARPLRLRSHCSAAMPKPAPR